MASQSEARRPHNFSPLIYEKICGMTSAAIKTRVCGGWGGVGWGGGVYTGESRWLIELGHGGGEVL